MSAVSCLSSPYIHYVMLREAKNVLWLRHAFSRGSNGFDQSIFHSCSFFSALSFCNIRFHETQAHARDERKKWSLSSTDSIARSKIPYTKLIFFTTRLRRFTEDVLSKDSLPRNNILLSLALLSWWSSLLSLRTLLRYSHIMKTIPYVLRYKIM